MVSNYGFLDVLDAQLVYFIIYGGSWFSGTIIGCVDSDRFLVQYRRNSVESTVVSLHQLRLLPPPESHREFKSGDKVVVFHDHRWRDGHVTADLVNGRFVVSFRDSEEMMLPKEQLRDRISCSLHNDARVLRISNSTLSRLTIFGGQACQILLSTPNLGSFTIFNGTVSHQLFSTCNLSFLGEVNIDMNWDGGSDEGWGEESSIIMK
ncbi:hypothetical protein JHK86_025081 [Glycine max]|nr:hypothetical protein JHK86_025081 [Glycine max]